MPDERLDPARTALIAYDVCRRALEPADPARREAMRPTLEAWVRLIGAAREAGLPVIYTTPVSRIDGADVVMLPTDLSAETGVPPLTNAVEGLQTRTSPKRLPHNLRITSSSSAGLAHSTGREWPNSCICCGVTSLSSVVAPPIAALRRVSAKPSISISLVSSCASAAGEAM